VESNIEPEELNLSQGLAVTLVDKMVLHKSKGASHNGVDTEEQRWKQKATAEERHQAQDKRISTGSLAAAGHYNLGNDVRDHVQQRSDSVKEKECNMYLHYGTWHVFSVSGIYDVYYATYVVITCV
jgi:hypothetical protein